jgi:hypothetical protein
MDVIGWHSLESRCAVSAIVILCAKSVSFERVVCKRRAFFWRVHVSLPAKLLLEKSLQFSDRKEQMPCAFVRPNQASID